MTPLSASDGGLSDEANGAPKVSDELMGLLSKNAPTSEHDRRVAVESIHAMRDAGLFRILTPRTYGGSEAGLRAQVDTLGAVATADFAAAWVQAVSNSHAGIIGSFPDECQEEVFKNGPDGLFPGALASQGRAVRVDGGWTLSGRWQFASGIDYGEWVILGAVSDQPPESPDRAIHAIAVKSDLVVDDTWFTLGLRGTGSKDIVANNVFVPQHRAISTRDLFGGLSPYGERHATHFNRIAVLVCLAVQVAAVMVGAAEGHLNAYVAYTKSRTNRYTSKAKGDEAGVAMRIAEAQAELTSARLLVQRAASRCDVVGSSGVPLTVDERAELKWHAAYVSELCRRATSRLYASAGARSVYDDSALQAAFRDINTASHHAILDFDGGSLAMGRSRLGLDPGPLV